MAHDVNNFDEMCENKFKPQFESGFKRISFSILLNLCARTVGQTWEVMSVRDEIRIFFNFPMGSSYFPFIFRSILYFFIKCVLKAFCGFIKFTFKRSFPVVLGLMEIKKWILVRG